MFWSCFGHVSVDLIKYPNEYAVIVRNRTRCVTNVLQKCKKEELLPP